MSNRRKSVAERQEQYQRNHENHITVHADGTKSASKHYFTAVKKFAKNMAAFQRNRTNIRGDK